MNTRNKIPNDLTVIKGIGPARQEWLRNKLNVRTYKNLVDMPSEEIISRLKSDGQIVSQADVEMWIAQAQTLSITAGPGNSGEWEPFASFVVEFQVNSDNNCSEQFCTVVQHMETDVDQRWSGLESELLCHWIKERVEKSLVKVKPNPPVILNTIPPTISGDQIQAFQPPYTNKACAYCIPGRPFQGCVHADQLFELRVILSIDGCDVSEIQKAGVQFISQFYSSRFPRGEIIHIGDTESLPLGDCKNSYVSILPDLSMPTGMYNIKVLSKILLNPPIYTCLEGKYFQVI